MAEAFVQGNTAGVGKHLLQQFAAWDGQMLPKSTIVDAQLAAFLVEATQRLGQEIAVYLNRQGRVLSFHIGDSSSVQLPSVAARRSEQQLSGIRCIHTHPGGLGALSELDLTAALRMRWDCLAAIGVAASGPTTVGLVWGGPVRLEELQPLLLGSVAELLELDFWLQIQQQEKERRRALALAEPADFGGRERGILFALSAGRTEDEVEGSLKELRSLAETARVEVVETVVQRREKPSPATYIHAGKAQELAQLVQTGGAQVLIIDAEIGHGQLARLSDLVGAKVVDRSMLILDIFAQRARSNEGKLQVELAQMHYTLPRILGQGKQLSRLAGGIGTRGPGESQLETDRRHIRRRIQELENSLEQVRRTRDLHRRQRQAQALPVVALVGYTNAGKSTLLNALTEADAFAEDLLFATLDPVTRRAAAPYGGDFLVSDTVGFIRRLPHHLIAAFRATLEEVTEADLLLHVIDAAAADWREQSDAVMEVLAELQALEKPLIAVINKIDLVPQQAQIRRLLDAYPQSVAVSAQKRQGIDALLREIDKQLPQNLREFQLLLPFSAGNLLAALHKEGQVLRQEYEAEGIRLWVKAPRPYWAKLQPFEQADDDGRL